MKIYIYLITMVMLATASHAANGIMQPLEKDISLTEAIQKANEVFINQPLLTEAEVIAAVKAIKLKHPEIDQETYDTYMRVVEEQVLPKGMYFDRIQAWRTEYGEFRVAWLDLCFQGRAATETERRELLLKLEERIVGEPTHKQRLSKMHSELELSDIVWVGGFSYRIRSRFISTIDSSTEM